MFSVSLVTFFFSSWFCLFLCVREAQTSLNTPGTTEAEKCGKVNHRLEKSRGCATSPLRNRPIVSYAQKAVTACVSDAWVFGRSTWKRRVAEGRSTHTSSKNPSNDKILFLVFSERLNVLWIWASVEIRDQRSVSQCEWCSRGICTGRHLKTTSAARPPPSPIISLGTVRDPF